MCIHCLALERKLALIRQSGKEPEDADTLQRFNALIADVERQLDSMRKRHPLTVH
jgi:hypothetical protein